MERYMSRVEVKKAVESLNVSRVVVYFESVEQGYDIVVNVYISDLNEKFYDFCVATMDSHVDAFKEGKCIFNTLRRQYRGKVTFTQK